MTYAEMKTIDDAWHALLVAQFGDDGAIVTRYYARAAAVAGKAPPPMNDACLQSYDAYKAARALYWAPGNAANRVKLA